MRMCGSSWPKGIGYSITGAVSEQVLILAIGAGANGKTTLLEAVRTVLGDYASAAEPDLLLARGEAHPTGIARLQGARFVVATESDEGRRLAEGTVKRLTGGDRLTARYMHQNFFEFAPSHTLWLCTNHRPDVRGVDHAIWRRLRVAPFNVTIATEDQDPHLLERLTAESAGILAWAVRACLRWQAEGLGEPVAVKMATTAYRQDQDIIGEFLDETASSSPTR